MYKEIDEMSKDELAGLVALTRKDFKNTPKDLVKKYTDEGLKLELFQWITQEEYKKVITYKDKEPEIIREIAEIWGCEESLSIKKTEAKIAEKVILEIVKNLSSEQREKLAKAIEEKEGLSEADTTPIKNFLLGKGKFSDLPLWLYFLLPLVVETTPPLPLVLLFPIGIGKIFSKWFIQPKQRKYGLGIIIALCVMKRIEKKELGN